MDTSQQNNTHQPPSSPPKKTSWSLGVVLVLIAGVAVLGLGAYIILVPAGSLSCDSIDMNPPELSFEMNYCSGTYCTATTQADCEAIDVVDNRLRSAVDGTVDCAWLENTCVPNK